MYPIDFFFRAAEQYPDRVALDAPEGQVTYARLAADVRALAAALQDLAPAPQTRVALCACLLYTSPSPRDRQKSRMPSSA